MGSAIGIHIDHRRFRLIALDGSVKKHRISARINGEIPADADPVAFVAGELKRHVKEQKLAPDGVSLAVDSGLAAFRTLSLPFDDRSKIEEVIKFEVETDLPQWDIDDVIVDFHITDAKPGVSSDLLVTAIPKERLAHQIEACEQAGLEPTEAELEGTALFSAAAQAGLFDEESAQLLVHIGDSTTSVVVVDGGRLISMRAIHVGGDALRIEAAEGQEAGEGEGAEPVGAEEERETGERLARNAQRVQRELARTVSGVRTRHDFDAIYVFGGTLPGFDGGTLLDLPVERPAILPEEEPAPDSSELAVAYGAALRQLGVASCAGHLRREELRYSGKFERLELPLAVFLLLLATLLGVKLIVTYQKLQMFDEGVIGEAEGDIQFWLRASNQWMLPNAETMYPGRLKNPPESILAYARKAERGEDHDRTKFEELREIRRRLDVEIINLEKELGISKRTATTGEIPMPQSALRALTLVFDVIDELGDDIGRIGIRKIKADSQTKNSGQEQFVSIRLDMDFFADDSLSGNEASIQATEHYSNFVNAIQKAPWYRHFERKATESFDNGIGSDGMVIEVDLSKIPLDETDGAEGEA